ncbi:hypothetical protein RFI_00882, partial [Reticulomyxa filosa]
MEQLNCTSTFFYVPANQCYLEHEKDKGREQTQKKKKKKKSKRLTANTLSCEMKNRLNQKQPQGYIPRQTKTLSNKELTTQTKVLPSNKELTAYWSEFDKKYVRTTDPINKKDWWGRSEQHLSEKEQMPVRVRAEKEISKAREEWIEREFSNRNRSLWPDSHHVDANNCIIYVDTRPDKIAWHPPSSALCNWKNNAIFWHSMHGTMVGKNFRDSGLICVYIYVYIFTYNLFMY